MRIVERPAHRPQRCAVLPQIGATHNGVWVDTGSELIGGFDNRVYVSDVAVGELAKLMGYVSRGQHQSLLGELEKTKRLLEVALHERAEMERKLEAIDVIESAGFRSRKKPGRPKVEA